MFKYDVVSTYGQAMYPGHEFANSSADSDRFADAAKRRTSNYLIISQPIA